MDVEYLQSLHRDTCQDARHQRTDGSHLRVRHKDVERNEHARHQHVRQQVNQQSDKRPQQQEVWHRVGYCRHEYRDTRGQHDDNGKQEEHGQIVGKRTENTPRFLNLPYLVKRILDIAY